jgi:hypothetical protein
MGLVATSPGLVLPEDVIRKGASLAPDRDFDLHRDSVRNALIELVAKIKATNLS